MRRLAVFFAWIGLSLFAIAVSGRIVLGAPATEWSDPPPAKAAAREAPPLSEAECRAYADAVLAAVRKHDKSALSGLMDWDALFERTFAGLEISDRDRSDYIKGFRQSLDSPTGFAPQIIAKVKHGGAISLLRVQKHQGRRVLLFRFILPAAEGGVDYIELEPRRSPDGRARAVDVYFYLMGDFLSEGLRRAILPLIAEKSRTSLSKLLLGEQDYVRDLPRLGEANRLIAQGKPAEALAIHESLRPGTRRLKHVLMARMVAAQRANQDDKYLAVIDEIRHLFPDDACIDLISVDGFALRKQYDAAMKALDRLDVSIGGDAFLDTVRADLCELQDDPAGARRFLLRAVEKEPTLISVHWRLVTDSLDAKDYAETLHRLEEIDRHFKMNFKDLSQIPIYAGFVKSPQYKEWLAYLDAKKPAPEPKDASNDAPKSSGSAASPGAGVTPPGSAATTPR